MTERTPEEEAEYASFRQDQENWRKMGAGRNVSIRSVLIWALLLLGLGAVFIFWLFVISLW